MRIVKVVAKGVPLYQDEMLTLDLYATDRVAKNEDGSISDVTRLGTSGAVYSNNVLGFVALTPLARHRRSICWSLSSRISQAAGYRADFCF